MKIFELYDKTKTYIYPNGSIATPERVASDYPFTQVKKAIIETDIEGDMLYSMDMFSSIKTMYNIDTSLSDEEAIAEITRIANEEPEQEINDNTRIADALEDLVVLSMPDLDE